jgi:hypothetical protein
MEQSRLYVAACPETSALPGPQEIDSVERKFVSLLAHKELQQNQLFVGTFPAAFIET